MKPLLVVIPLAAVAAVAAHAPAAAADAQGHHVHLTAPSPEDAARWYIKHMECEAVATRKDATQCGTVQLLFYRRAPKAGSEGTGLNHIGFAFRNLAQKMKEFEADGVKITMPMQGDSPKVGYVEDPWGTRIEVIEDPQSLGLYHAHLRTPDPEATLKWYKNAFGGEVRKRRLSGTEGLLYGGTFWVLASKAAASELPLQPTDGRAIDHLGFSFADLEASAAELKAKGLTLRNDVRTVTNAIGETLKVAFLVGPDNVLIELIQPPK
jgi:catechol 2,3-dioxygenase-like lactoylglutathione lyase family enzyme